MGKFDCELYKDRYVIVPVIGKEGHCTAIFDINNKKWMKLKKDGRSGNGTLVNASDKILFLGREDGSVWQFMGLDQPWHNFRDIEIPLNIANNGTKIIAMDPQFCKDN